MKKNMDIKFHHSILHRSNGYVTKFLETEYDFGPNEKERLVEDLLEFRRRLSSNGVPITEDYELFIKEGNKNVPDVIVEQTLNCGMDGYKVIKADSGSKREIVLCKIIRALLPILEKSEINLVPDPHPANWCFDKEGEMHYVDFQPPRFERNDGIKLVGFPQPIGKEYEWSIGRYYSKAGLIRILRFNAMRAGGSSMRELLLSVMKKELPVNLFTEIVDELENLLEERVRRNELSVFEALERCDVWSIDDIRELAMILAESMGKRSTFFLDRVLETTRADFNIPLNLRKKSVENAKKLILQNVLQNT